MSYNNYNRGYNRSYNNNGYNYNNGSGRSYNNSYRSSSNSYNHSPRKKSGCKIGTDKNGGLYISAWRVNKTGLYSLYARAYKKTRESVSDKGTHWLNLFVTITNKSTNTITNHSGMYDINRKRLYLKELNLICTTNGQGGYFGKHISKR